jgi:hypothetical protein
LKKMNPWRKTRDAKAGTATNGHWPADEFGARHFRRVEFELAAHAVENVARLVVGEEREVDAARLNLAGIEAQHAVVEAAGERHRKRRHASVL